MSGTYEMHADQSVHPPDVVTLKSQCLYNSFGCADLIKRIQNNILGLHSPRAALERTDMPSLILRLSLIYLVKEHLVVKTRYKRSLSGKPLYLILMRIVLPMVLTLHFTTTLPLTRKVVELCGIERGGHPSQTAGLR